MSPNHRFSPRPNRNGPFGSTTRARAKGADLYSLGFVYAMLPFGSLRKLTERLSRIVGCRPREDSILCPALFSSAVMVNILSGDHNSSGVADWFEQSRETVALSLTLAGKLDWPFKFWAVQVFAANFCTDSGDN